MYMKNLFAEVFAKAAFFNAIETLHFEENLIVATRKDFCESKPFPVIAKNLKHKKQQNKHWRFLSMLLKAQAFFADVERKVFKPIEAFYYNKKYMKILC